MKIVVTGGTGMVGSAFNKINTKHQLVLIGSKDADLLSRPQFSDLLALHKPDAVIHLAARVGGVKGNTDFVSDFYSENIRINTNVLDCCHSHDIQKVVSLLSTCVYPDDVQYPLTEDQIHNGEPHRSNFGYAYAKRMLDIHSRALRQQHGRNYVCAVPNNLYGINDNFDLENGHVIPAIIRKIWEAKKTDQPPVFWGDGSPLREFTFAEDIANALMFVLENYNEEAPVNIGNTDEVSIRHVVQTVSQLLNYSGHVVWDDTMPSGQYKKPSSNARFLNTGWNPENYTTLSTGLKKTVDWFVDQYPDLRGIL